MERELAVERRVNEILATYPDIARAGMLAVLALQDSAERARVIGKLYAAPDFRSLAELMIDLEADPPMRVFIVGMLREYENRQLRGQERD